MNAVEAVLTEHMTREQREQWDYDISPEGIEAYNREHTAESGDTFDPAVLAAMRAMRG